MTVHRDTDGGVDGSVGDLPVADLTWIASKNTATYTTSSGRLAHSRISAQTSSVIREIVSFDTAAP